MTIIYIKINYVDKHFFRIPVTIVSDPDDDAEQDCVDVGKAYVSIRDILRTDKDIEQQDVDSEFIHRC